MSSRLIIAAQSGVVIGLLVLAVVLARQLGEAQRELAAASQTPVELPTNSSPRPSRLRLQQLPAINLPTRVEHLDWRSIESEDYATYVANLRKAGCPEETIRDIIVADVDKAFAARRRAIGPGDGPWEFWINQEEVSNPSDAARDREAELETLERERRRLLTNLLGESWTRLQLQDLFENAVSDRALQFLPEEKRQAVALAQAALRQGEEELESLTDDKQRKEKREAIQKTYEDAMASALTPREREQFELRGSSLADNMRQQLRGFGTTRDEFEKLFHLERDYAAELSQLEASRAAGSDPQAAQKLEAAAIQQEARIKETLGPERYSDYQRVRDSDYQTLYGLAREHDMPSSVANQVWDMRHAVELQTGRIRENPLLTADQKVRALEAIRGETQSAIVEVLGQPLLDEYSRQGGKWLSDLTDTERLGETGVEIIPPPLPEPQVTVESVPTVRTTRRRGR